MPTPAGYQGYRGPVPKKTRRTLILTLVVLVVIVLIVVYAVATVETPGKQGPPAYLVTPGIPCDGRTLPTYIAQVEESTAFLNVSGGACYNYIPGQLGTSSTGNQTLVFDLYNGTVFYPCGVAPEPAIENQIEVSVNQTFGVQYLQLNTDAADLNGFYLCGTNAPAVGVVSVQYIEVTIPAVPEVNVTLYTLQGGEPVTGLTAALAIAGSNYTISFDVTQSSPLLPGHTVSAVQVVNQAISNATQIFPMLISGTFLDGQTFAYEVQVVIASTYAA